MPGAIRAEGRIIADIAQARSLPGRHNAQNAAFAYAAARALGVSHDAAVEGLMTFPGLAHRMEAVGRLGSIRFINDSKGTNADAARQALASYPSVFWIAGGRAKEGGIDSMADLYDVTGLVLPIVAEKLGRKWIGCDLGRFAIHAQTPSPLR